MAHELLHALRRNFSDAIGSRRYADAASILERVEAEDPASGDTRAMALRLLVETGKLDEAAALAKQLVALFPGSSRILWLAGRVALKQRRHADAEALLRESHRLYPHWRSALALASSLTNQGRYDESERLLLPLVEAHPEHRPALSWLYERKGENARALAIVEAHLEAHPADRGAEAQRLRLRAALLPAAEVVTDADAMLDLGDALPEAVEPRYLESLLSTGDGDRARAWSRARLPGLSPRAALRLAWPAYHSSAHDIAVDLFLAALPEHLGDDKLRRSLEAACLRAGRAEDVASAYDELAARDPRFWGRATSLRRRAARTGWRG